jgi:Sulfotransferase domain
VTPIEPVPRTVCFIECRARDGCGPICEGLGLAIPDEPFPHVKTSADFRSRLAMD